MSDEAQYSDSGEHHTTVTDNPNSNTKASATVDDLPPEPTTTVTTADDDTNNNNNSSTSSQMANGLSYTISTIIRDFDTQAQHTSRSQDQLSSAIDRLTNGNRSYGTSCILKLGLLIILHCICQLCFHG
ncbi:hypothetical protein HanOQP8_Chr13g0488931 [Helianthus annuus]|nr:hypothetical protein HanOQP8_Chr13g0488931 [Helianthus annuus]